MKPKLFFPLQTPVVLNWWILVFWVTPKELDSATRL